MNEEKLISLLLFLFTLQSIIICKVPQIQYDALAEFYNATNGDNWVNNSNWLNGDPCEDFWHGIYCQSTNDSVIDIAISLNNLQGTIPNSISNLIDMNSLILNNNTLVGTIPSSIGNLIHLSTFDLSSNQFEGTIPDSLQYTILDTLDLSNNKLEGGIPDYLGNMDLEFLYLANNQLNGTIPNILFYNNMNLQELMINNNNFIGTIPLTINALTLPKLSILKLNNNNLSGVLAYGAINLPYLTSLDVSNNGLRGTVPDSSVWDNLFGSTIPKACSFLINDNQLSGELPDYISNEPTNNKAFFDGSNNLFQCPLPQWCDDVDGNGLCAPCFDPSVSSTFSPSFSLTPSSSLTPSFTPSPLPSVNQTNNNVENDGMTEWILLGVIVVLVMLVVVMFIGTILLFFIHKQKMIVYSKLVSSNVNFE